MKYIELSKGYKAIVDDDDFEKLSTEKWCVSKSGYAVRNQIVDGKQITVHMHRVVFGEPTINSGFDVDHINGDKLDNRKENLRKASRAENLRNLHKKRPGCSSKYFGVHFCNTLKKWVAKIYINKKTINLGAYDIEIDAALAYNVAAEQNGFLTRNKIEGD